MDDIDEFEASLLSGDSDRVNRAIDAIGDLPQGDRAALFDDGIGMCRDLFESEDGYQRQAAVRFAENLHPRLALPAHGQERPDEAIPGDWTLADGADQRRRLTDLFLDGLADEDGRVRRSATIGLKQVASCAAMAGAADELQGMLDEIRELGENCDWQEREQVHEAYRDVDHQVSICE